MEVKIEKWLMAYGNYEHNGCMIHELAKLELQFSVT